MGDEEIKNKIWCIIRPNLVENRISNIGIMGTGFFISNNEFITSYHILNPKSFESNKDYNNEFVILLNPIEEQIIVTPDNAFYYKDKDITLIKLEGKHNFIELEEDAKEGQEVFNLGYPSEKINELISIKDERIILKSPIIQKGKILKLINNFSSKSNDVNIDNKKVIILNYSSVIGFSGGALLNLNGKAIGIMSMMIPKNRGTFSGKVIAVRSIELKW